MTTYFRIKTEENNNTYFVVVTNEGNRVAALGDSNDGMVFERTQTGNLFVFEAVYDRGRFITLSSDNQSIILEETNADNPRAAFEIYYVDGDRPDDYGLLANNGMLIGRDDDNYVTAVTEPNKSAPKSCWIECVVAS